MGAKPSTREEALPPTPETPAKRFSIALREISEEARARNVIVSQRAVAEKAGVTSPAVTAWFGGIQMPRADKLDAIAAAYSGGDPALLKTIRQRLFDAAGAQISAPVMRSAMERARGSGIVRIGVVDYPPVSDFLIEMLNAFSKYADFEANITASQSVASLTTNEPSDLANGERLDLVAGIFATPKRARDFHFIEMPLAMGVNALTFGFFKEKLVERRETDLHASDPEKRDMGRRRILPIVHPGEAGHQFAKQVLGFKEHEMNRCEYGAASFVDELVTTANGALNDGRARIPVVIADELAILNVYEQLIDRFASGDLDFGKLGPPEVLLQTARASDGDGDGGSASTKDLYPIFNLPICVGKGDDEWFDYVKEAWSIFVRSNVRYAAARYAELGKLLRKQVEHIAEVVKDHPNTFSGPRGKDLVATIEESWRERINSWLFGTDCPEWGHVLAQAREQLGEPAGQGTAATLAEAVARVEAEFDQLKKLVMRLEGQVA